MQTFLPYRSFIKTFQVLDHQRLRKQSVEGYQLLKGLVLDPNYYWNRHPASKMWKGYEPALTAYTALCSKTCLDLGFRNTIFSKLLLEFSPGLNTQSFAFFGALHSNLFIDELLIEDSNELEFSFNYRNECFSATFELPEWYKDEDFFDRHKCQLYHKDLEHYSMFEEYKGAGSYKWPVK